MADKQVAVIERKIIPLVEKAKALKITNPKQMTESVTLLSQMNKIADGIKAEKKTIIEPAKAIIKRENARWEAIEDQYEEAIKVIRSEQSAYQTEQTRIATEKAKTISDRVGEGRGKLKAETAVAKIDEIERPETTIATEAGVLKFRKQQRLKIWDITMIPLEYLVPDEAKILADLKAGKAVKGCEIEVIEVPVNIR